MKRGAPNRVALEPRIRRQHRYTFARILTGPKSRKPFGGAGLDYSVVLRVHAALSLGKSASAFSRPIAWRSAVVSPSSVMPLVVSASGT